jgi:hypothetical protein
MQAKDQVLCACTRQDFSPVHQQHVLDLCRRTPINWAHVYGTARQHGIAPLIYTNLTQPALSEIELPPMVKAEWERACFHNMMSKSLLAKNLQRTLAYFRQQGIELLLLKGAAMDILVYEQPWYTVHDVDLVIRSRREGLTPAQQQAIGDFFSKLPGFEYDFFEHHDVTMNGLLPVDFQRLWQQATPVEVGGEPVWVMRPEDLLLAACINACRKRFLRLKSLLDIAEIIRHYPDLAWAQVVADAQRYECSRIVYTALLATQQTVGCAVSGEVFAALAPNPVQQMAIHALVRLLLSSTSFASTYPFAGPSFLGKNTTWSLLLPYAIYSPVQAWRKLRELCKAATAFGQV